MNTRCAWLGVAALMFVCATSTAWAGDPLKPYVVLVLDTSGSMGGATGSGPPSCGGADTKLNHARCAIDRIVNSYGDMVFALGRFRMTMSGTTTAATFPTGCATGQNECSVDDDRFELLTPLVDGANKYAASWVNSSGNRCTAPSAFPIPVAEDPEIWQANGNTPIEGSLKGSRRYYQGQQSFANGDTSGGAGVTTIWPAATVGFDPIGNDPLKNAFLPRPASNAPTCNSDPTTCNASGACTGTNCCCLKQCRPYIVIMLTDGDETCPSGQAPNSATSLLTTPYPIMANGATAAGFKNYRIETKPIGFGKPVGDAQIETLAHLGGAADVAGVNEGYYANDEAGLQLAISSILADAIKTETCNNLDDDCDSLVDEDFPGKATMCSNNRQGKCLVSGANVCRTDGTGLACDSGQTACLAHSAGQACNVNNAAGANVVGTCITSPAGLVCNPTAAGTPGNPNNENPFGCNNIDDDCDGKIDENVAGCSCVPFGEQCNGLDDNCNGTVDDGIAPIPCGTGTCQGTRPCVGFVGCNAAPGCTGPTCCYGACSAATPTTEVCDGLDNNCDGNADGFTQACSNMSTGFPAFDPKNNPGGTHMPMSGCEALGPAKCICHPGIRTCPLNGPGTFGACLNEQQPRTEVCNGLDDDCDGLVDETPAITCTNDTQCAASPLTPSCDNPSNLPNMGTCMPADCSMGCGAGQLVCVNGMQQCNATPAPNDDTCNGNDDDCDGNVDEDWKCADPDGPDNIPGNADDCPCTSPNVCNGEQKCVNGAVVCDGDPVGQESCNCLDDNCNGQIDEGSLCASGASCTNCQCAFPCSQSEFPCPVGKTCIGNFCLADPCFGVTCPTVPGDLQQCAPKPGNPNDHVCVSACDPIVKTCNAPGTICYLPTGECKPDDCTTFPGRCSANQNCINGTCVTNLCQGVNCPSDQYCVGGQCFGSCADIDCPTGQRCRMGTCQADPCGKVCPAGQVCHDETGECVANPCEFVTCPQGQFCDANDNGMCKDDPCVGTTCPNPADVCKGGTCYDPNDFLPDAGVEEHVTTGGGGGCNAGSDGSGVLLLGLALGALVTRRRRGAGGAA